MLKNQMLVMVILFIYFDNLEYRKIGGGEGERWVRIIGALEFFSVYY